MKVEEHIQWLYDKYPDLFQTRKEALNEIFCVCGNGYQWRDGEIICEDHPITYTVTPKEIRGKAHQWKPSNSFSRRNGYMIFKWYNPFDEENRLNNPPPDINQDWAEALEEVKQLLKKDEVK